MTSPYYRPKTLTVRQQEEVVNKIRRIMYTRQYTKGEFVDRFEADLMYKLKNPRVITTSSGTMALYIAARATRDMYDYRTVQIPAYTYISTAQAFRMAGYRIDVCDVDRETFLINQRKDLGVVCGVDVFGNYWKPKGDAPFYIADATHSFGNPLVGQCADRRSIECFSFTGSKIMPCGEGGAITTNDDELYEHMLTIRDWAGRMSEMEAALGIQYILEMNNILQHRLLVAKNWQEQFPDLQWQKIPHETNYYAVAALVKDREHFLNALSHLEFKTYWSEPQVALYGDFPNAKYIADRVVCFPIDLVKVEDP